MIKIGILVVQSAEKLDCKLGDPGLGFEFLARARDFFFFFTASRLALLPTHPIVTGVPFPGDKAFGA
jgi:hypothetical protein